MAEHPKGWNRRVIGSLPCGCFVSSSTYEGHSEPSRLQHIAQLLEAGYVVSLVAWDDHDANNHHCENYPHEQWQIDYKRRLDAFNRSA